VKLFSRGNSNAAATGPASAVAPPPGALAAPPGAAAPTVPEAKPGPDVAELLESSVKDISEKVARLASTVESSMDERASIDAKLSQMEDRMRKLSSLTEMISAQYNPFVGDAPPQREPLPEAETGLAAPPLAASAAPLGLELSPPGLGPAMADPLDDGAAADFGLLPETPPAPRAPEPARDLMEPAGVRVERFSEDFQSSLLLLKWADLLLQNAQSREGVSELLGYYHNVGWIGDVARDQLQAYVDGIAHDGRAEGAGEWRATAEFHEVSLLFLERLKNLARGAR
jgi:hypothetical protein